MQDTHHYLKYGGLPTVSCYAGLWQSCPVLKHQVMKAYGGVDVQLHVFIASALDRTGWSAHRPVGKGHQYPLNMGHSRAGKA